MPSLVFDFHATAAFDFFSTMYFLIARRFFCLWRLCRFFRASCFMLFSLCAGINRRVGCLRMGVPHREFSITSSCEGIMTDDIPEGQAHCQAWVRG